MGRRGLRVMMTNDSIHLEDTGSTIMEVIKGCLCPAHQMGQSKPNEQHTEHPQTEQEQGMERSLFSQDSRKFLSDRSFWPSLIVGNVDVIHTVGVIGWQRTLATGSGGISRAVTQ